LSSKEWPPLTKLKEIFRNLFRDWKPLAVIAVFLWSVFTLLQIEPQDTINNWQRLAALSPKELRLNVQQSAESLEDWSKMNTYEREDVIKRMLEEAQLANNIQVLAKFKRYVLTTNQKSGSPFVLLAIQPETTVEQWKQLGSLSP
jgi:hypothetical protein